MTVVRAQAVFRTVNAGERSLPRGGRWLCRGLALVVVGLAGALAAPAAAGPAALRFGFSAQVFVDVNENDARAALKVWAQTMGGERGIPVDPAIQILNGTGDIQDALTAGTVDAVSMTTMEFWTLRHSGLIGPTVILGSANGRTTDEYVLLVHRDSPAQRLADLRGKSVAIVELSRASLATVWMETLLLDEHLGPADRFWGRSSNASKVSRVILPVFFRQTDACVVTREGFRTMSELNPQVGRQLRILAQSPALLPGIFCFRRDLVSPYRDKLVADVGRITDTVAGRQALNLFHADQLVARPISDTDETCALLDRHQRLLMEARDSDAAHSADAPQPPAGEGGR